MKTPMKRPFKSATVADLKSVFLAFAALFLAGCTSTRTSGGGYPESASIEISAPIDKVQRNILGNLAQNGMQVVSESPHSLRMEGPMTASANFWFTNTLTGERPRIQYQFTMIEVNGNTQVTAIVFMRHAPGLAGGQSMTPMKGEAVHQVARFLEAVKAAIESPPATAQAD